MKVRIKKKYGLPFFLNRHSRRAGVLAGISVCIAVLCILSTRIWSIDVIGNIRVSSEEIVSVFEELGVKKGTSGKKINISATEITALQRLPDVSWINININGCTALIEVRERVVSPESDEENQPSDIVAARDGQIVILRPFNGTQEQRIGNPVLKGDLLISGIEENKDLTVSFCKAKGYVVARTNRNVGLLQNSNFNAKKQISEKKSYMVDFLFLSVPFGRIPDNAYREKKEIFINGVTLPFALTECTYSQHAENKISLSKEQTTLLASLRFFDECSKQFRYLKIENSQISETVSESACTLGGKFVCLENIGEERKMQIEESEPATDT